MDNKEAEKIEQEIFISLKEKIANLSNKDIEKAIEGEVKRRNYLKEDWQVYYAVQRIKEKKEKNNELKEEKSETKPFKFYWFTPGTPKQTAYRGLIMILIAAGLQVLGGGLISDIIGLLGFLTLLEALIVFARNKIRKNKRKDK